MENRHLLLIIPPQFGLLKGFTTGLLSIANYVNKNITDINIRILDFSAKTLFEVENELKNLPRQPHDNFIAGITTTTANYQSSLHVSKLLKKVLSNCTVIHGGHHASNDSEIILKSNVDSVDYIIIGEGEKPMTEFAKRFPYVNEIRGLAYLRNGKYFENPPSERLNQNELDSIPITYKGNGFCESPGKFDHVTYVSARGCPLKCSFCSVANQSIIHKSVTQIIKDLKQLLDMGFKRIAIEDNFFAHNPKRTRELCNALIDFRKSNNNFNWDCQTRVESLKNKEIIDLMEKAGCDAVYIGVESFNPDMLLYLGKTINPDTYLTMLFETVIPQLLESSINCYINLQVGLPDETEKHHDYTYQILKKLGDTADKFKKEITIFPQLHVIYPGTANYFKGIDENLFPINVFESFTAWEYEHKPIINWLGEHFAHGTGGLPIGILNREKLRIREYEIDNDAIFRISNLLKKLERIIGINVFKYGYYLVEENPKEAVNY